MHNLSSIALSHTQLQALSLGPNFKIPANKVSRLETKAHFENLFDQLSSLNAANNDYVPWLKSKLVDICYDHLNRPVHKINMLTNEHMSALKSLLKQEVMILKPDKGSRLVVIDKCDYIRKMEDILNDTAKFKRCDNVEKLQDIENKIVRQLRILLCHNFINKRIFKHLKPVGTKYPHMYGLPKIHKEGVPLRPILSMCGSPYHQLAKYLVQLLQPISKDIATHSLTDSFALLPYLDTINIDGKTMASLNVQSLFTNVPLIETVDIICSYIMVNKISVNIPIELLRPLILTCTLNVPFLFQNRRYIQIDGVAMGSPLGPIIANIFMAAMERKVSGSINQFVLYKRYVDDILVVADKREKIQLLLEQFNSVHKNLSLTCEYEKDNQLPFLDILISRRIDGTISRSVYHKPTWSGQYLSFYSFTPNQHKRALVTTLFNRVMKICTPENVDQEKQLLTTTLMENGYPERFIATNSELSNEGPLIPTVSKKKVFIRLIYKGENHFQTTKKRLNAAVARCYPAAQLQVVARTFSMPLPAINMPTSILATSHCVYKFECRCGASYIGRTDRRLECRIAEHLPKRMMQRIARDELISTTDKRSSTPLSSIARHIAATNHVNDPQTSFTVLLRNVNSKVIQFAEAIAIRSSQPLLCQQKAQFVCPKLGWW